MKVFLVNTYSMEEAFSLWQKGKSGSHHVWGKVELEKKGTIQMGIFRHEKFGFLNKIGKAFGIKHLDQQIRLLGSYRKFDILYAPYSLANTTLLVVLKWLGLFKKPIVVTIHQPFLGTKSPNRWIKILTKKILLQYEASIFLSEQLKKDTAELLEIPASIMKQKFRTAQWGPDVDFYKDLHLDYPLEDCNYVISAGHTDRDYETLIEAFKEIDFQLKIFCAPWSIPANIELPDNVSVYSKGIPYFELLAHYKKARVILIPLNYPARKEGCQGMTSIQDVVALGKPVIMTKNVSLNLNIEEEGFGSYVERKDVYGWRKSVNDLIFNEKLLINMGKNANKVYRTKFNSEIFANNLEQVFFEVYHHAKKQY